MRPLLALLALALMHPVPASAARGVVYEPSEGSIDYAKKAWMLQFGDDIGVRWTSVSEVFSDDEPVTVLGGGSRHECTRKAAGTQALEAATHAIVSEVTRMNYDTAGLAIDRARDMLPCLTRAPSPELLAGFHFMRGIVAFYAEGTAKASERFQEALLVSPFLQWDTRYPPPVKPSFEGAIAGAMTAPTAFLSISPRVTKEGRLWLNGVEVDLRTRTRSLYSGTHLIQWAPDDATDTTNWVLDLKEGTSVAIVARRDAVDGLLAGDADAAVTEFTQAQILAPVERKAGSTLYVARSGEPVQFHGYDPLGSRWRPVDALSLKRHVSNGKRLQGIGVGLTILGSVFAGVGAGLYAHQRGEARRLEAIILPDQNRPGQREDYDKHIGEHTLHTQQANNGGFLGIVGGTLLLGGVPLAIIGSRRAAGAGFQRADPSR